MPVAIPDLRSFKDSFDPLLLRELDRHIARAHAFTSDESSIALLAHVKELASSGGKRLRPYAAYLMYKACGGADSEEILETLTALEIFHLFALIHDDIIDRGLVRHGLPTLHEFARARMEYAGVEGSRVADSLALLTGDLVFNWSKETFAKNLPVVSAGEIQELFDKMICAVVLGQMLDVRMVVQTVVTEEEIMKKTLLKTAQYTFIFPLQIGAALATTQDTQKTWCEDFGTALGVAFQLQDDLLDIIGEESTTGKRPLQDVVEGQHTIFTAYIQNKGTDADRAVLHAVFGKEITADVRTVVQGLFHKSGAIAHGRERIAIELTTARDLLEKSTITDSAKTAFTALIDAMESRVA